MSICRLLLITLCAASAVANAVAAELVLRDFAAPRGAVVRLGDVADLMVTNDASSTGNGAAGLLDTPLMPSPAPGTKQFLRLSELRDVLAGRGVDVRKMTFSGAEVVTISSSLPDSPNNDTDSASGNTRLPLDNQDRVELLTNAITEYLRTQTNHELWRVQVELEPEAATFLDKARSSFSVAGGKAPWSGRQRFEINAESGRSRASVYARIDRLHTAVFAVRQIVKGDLVRRGDVELRSHVGALPVQATDSLDAVVGKEAIQGIRADSMVAVNQIRSPIIVRRNERVSVRVRAAGVVVRTYAIAQQDGSLGELVLVQSLEGKERFAARVSGLRELEIMAAGASAIDLAARP